MFSWLGNAWRVPELRKRVLFTAMILAFYRFGAWVPAPGVNSDQIKNYFNGQGGTILGLLNIFSGGALSQFSLFALGIMPYVTASIILQLLTVVIPSLEQLQDDRGRDVRHDPEREQREPRERGAGECVQQREDARAPTAAVEEVRDRRRVDARRGDPRAEPVDGKHAGREEKAPA